MEKHLKTQEIREFELLDDIKKRLEVMINLLLQSRPRNSEELSLREQIELLHNFGLKPKEISEVLQRSKVYINKEIFELRKSKKLRK
jgi:hypothetical protein